MATMTQADADQMIQDLLLRSRWSHLVVDPATTISHPIGWAIFPRDSAAAGPSFGLGPFIVTAGGAVFATGSGHPADAYLEDVCVMTGATWNPFRVLRYLYRRILDGRTPTRVDLTAPSPIERLLGG